MQVRNSSGSTVYNDCYIIAVRKQPKTIEIKVQCKLYNLSETEPLNEWTLWKLSQWVFKNTE